MNKAFCLVILTLSLNLGWTQTDDNLQKHERWLQACYDNFTQPDWDIQDSVWANPMIFEQHFRQVLSRPSSFDYPFDKLASSRLSIGFNFHQIRSPDNRLRLFMWDTRQGGMSNPEIDHLVQYKDAKGYLRVSDLTEFSGWVDDEQSVDGNDMEYRSLHSIRSGRKRYYLLQGMEKSCGTCWFYAVEAYEIKGEKFVPAALFESSDRLSSRIFLSKFSASSYDPATRELTFDRIEAEDSISGPVSSRKRIVMRFSTDRFKIIKEVDIPID